MTYVTNDDYSDRSRNMQDLMECRIVSTIQRKIELARNEMARRERSLEVIADYIRVAEEVCIPIARATPTLTKIVLDRGTDDDGRIQYQVYRETISLRRPVDIWLSYCHKNVDSDIYDKKDVFDGKNRLNAVKRAMERAEELGCDIDVSGFRLQSPNMVPEEIIPLCRRIPHIYELDMEHKIAYQDATYYDAVDASIADHIDEQIEIEKIHAEERRCP